MRYARLLLPHFKDAGAEGQRGKAICPRFCDQEVAEPGLKSRSPGSIRKAFNYLTLTRENMSTPIPKLLTVQRRFDKSKL